MFKVFITGRLCRDAEAKKGSSTALYYTNRIAVDRNKKLKPGEQKAIFIDIVAWDYTAKYLSECANKGTMIALYGDYDIDGKESKDATETYPIIKVDRAEIMIKGKEELKFKAENPDAVDWMNDAPAAKEDEEEVPQEQLDKLRSLVEDDDFPF